jgi:hypothetical protein
MSTSVPLTPCTLHPLSRRGDFDSDSGDDVEGYTDDDEHDDGSGPYSPPMEEDE